jgi:hypothetical protein
VPRRIRTVYPYQRVILDERFDGAADAAYGADRGYFLAIGALALIGTVLGEYGARGAGLETCSTGDARRCSQRLIEVGNNHVFPTAIAEIERVNANNFVAGPDTSATQNTAVMVKNKVIVH